MACNSPSNAPFTVTLIFFLFWGGRGTSQLSEYHSRFEQDHCPSLRRENHAFETALEPVSGTSPGRAENVRGAFERRREPGQEGGATIIKSKPLEDAGPGGLLKTEGHPASNATTFP
jgi:hypothetical protein